MASRQLNIPISFIASIGFGLTIGATLTLGSSSSFFGANNKETMYNVERSGFFLLIAGVADGIALASSIASQAAQAFRRPETHPVQHHESGHFYYMCVFMVVWAPPMFIIVATLIAGEGMAIFSLPVGSILQGGTMVCIIADLV